MNMDNKKICGTCWYSEGVDEDGWACTCDESDNCGEFTDYNHTCPEWREV